MARTSHGWGRPISREARGYGHAHRKRRKALLLAEPNCRECAKEGREIKASHADHIVPKCLGGLDTLANLQPLCLSHSRSKTGREGNMVRAARRRARREDEAKRQAGQG